MEKTCPCPTHGSTQRSRFLFLSLYNRTEKWNQHMIPLSKIFIHFKRFNTFHLPHSHSLSSFTDDFRKSISLFIDNFFYIYSLQRFDINRMENHECDFNEKNIFMNENWCDGFVVQQRVLLVKRHSARFDRILLVD